MNMKQYILAFGATLLLSGCGIYTRYEAQTTVPDNLYGDEAETVATDTVGLADETAVSQMKGTYYEVENSVIDLEEQISQVENSLSLLLAETPHSFQRGKLSEQEFTSELSTGIPLRMLSQRPDVRMAERQLEQAFYVTNQANSAFYPSITLSGSAGWTNSVGSIITNPAKFVTSALASLTQPLFNRGPLSDSVVSPRHSRKKRFWLSASSC